MKIRPVGAELFHADRRTYIHEANSHFCNFANTPRYMNMVPGCALGIHQSELQTTLWYLLLVCRAHLAVSGNAEEWFFLFNCSRDGFHHIVYC
jgi:hypothetical protein